MLDSIYKVDLLLRMAMKFFWYLDVTWHLQQKIFLLKKIFYVFFPYVFQLEKKIFFIKPAYVLSNLKKNFGRHFVFSKIDQIMGGPPTSHFLTFQNFF